MRAFLGKQAIQLSLKFRLWILLHTPHHSNLSANTPYIKYMYMYIQVCIAFIFNIHVQVNVSLYKLFSTDSP